MISRTCRKFLMSGYFIYHNWPIEISSDVFCCLASTRADAGSAEKFVKIDQTYVLNSAKLIQEENKPADSVLAPVHFLYCSSRVRNNTRNSCRLLTIDTIWKGRR